MSSKGLRSGWVPGLRWLSIKKINPTEHPTAMIISKLGGRLRDQMECFLGNLSGLPKTSHRFCKEALFGITTKQSLHLSEIGRSLNEPIRLIKTENRLSRQAAREGLSEKLHHFVISQSVHRIKKNTLIVVDPSDLTKKYGKKMEHIARVRDGSEKTIANGYWLCQMIAVECGGQEITPLVNHLWSQNAPGHLSENNEVLKCIEMVAAHTGENGIIVIDRGGDRRSLFKELLPKNRRFLIRLRGDRHLIHQGKTVLAEELAAKCPIKYIDHVVKQRADGTEQNVELRYGMRRVFLPGFPDKELRLVVLHGFGEKPLMILTTEPLTDSRKSLWWAIEAYLTRWRIEDTLRFAKQTYALEDVRVLGYQSLKNMMALALLAMSFTMLWLGQKEKLAILARHALTAAKTLFGIADFRYYALASGLAHILEKRTTAPFPQSESLTNDAQLDILELFDG